jgi:hypothetical protein
LNVKDKTAFSLPLSHVHFGYRVSRCQFSSSSFAMGRWLALGFLATASGKVYFSETFGSGWENRWTSSEWKKSDGTQGTWKLSPGKWYKDGASPGP